MVRVVYPSLDFKDVMFAIGKLTSSSQDIILRGRLFQYVPLELDT